MTASIRQELATIVSSEAILPDGAMGSWPHDVPSPSVFLEPGSEEEVALILERASREGWRILPSGAGSWIQGRGVPEVDIVLSTRRLGAMHIYEPADLTFTAGAGLPFERLQETTRANGQWLPLDPPGAAKGTLGALVSTGMAGPLRHAYGPPRDLVLGLTLVAGDGRVLRWGGRVVKNVAGFDVTRLSIGSWGSLGVITSVSARLFPLPEEDRTLLLTGPSAEDLLPMAREAALSSLPFSAVELLDPLESVGAGGGGRAGLAIRLLGSRAQVEEMEERGRRTLGGEPGVGRKMVTLGPDESRGFHKALGSWEEGARLVLRLSLLPAKMEELVAHARVLVHEFEEAGCGGARLAFHLGWGVMRIAFEKLPAKDEGMEGMGRILLRLRSELEGEGGSLILSEGPAELLRRVGPSERPEAENTLVAGLKRVFDPQGILSPGRLTG